MVQAAVRTTASAEAIWVICAVAVVCLAFWLGMVMVVANRPIVRHRRVTGLPGPVLGGIHLAEGGRSVAPSRNAPAVLGDFGTGGRPAPARGPVTARADPAAADNGAGHPG